MDDEQGACRFRGGRRHGQPAREVGAGFDGCQRLGRIGRGVGDRGGEIGRVGHDVVEAAEIGRQRLGEVVNDRSHPVGHAVEVGISFGQLGQSRLQLDADDAAACQPRRQAEADGADAGAEIEDALAGRGIDGSRQQHGVDGDAIAAGGL